MALYRRDVEEIKQLRRNATRKLRRLTLKGIDVSSIDPRRPMSDLSSMSRKELNNYKKSLRQFNSRKTQYIPGHRRKPISQGLWNRYVKERAKAEKALARENSRYANIPTHGMTLKEYMAMRKPDFPALDDPAANSYYYPSKRAAKSFKTDAALRKAIKQMKDRQKPDFLDRNIRRSRRNANKMIAHYGDKELMKRLRNLSDERFDLLWRFSRFADAIAAKYEYYQRIARGIPTQDFTDFADVVSSDALKWAEELDLNDVPKRRNRR